MKAKGLYIAGLAASALLALTGPAAGQGQPLVMLDRLDAGRWELRIRDSAAPAQSLCVTNGRRFIQLRHPDSACERFIVEDTLGEVTVQYTCRGKGYGRTHIRRETNRLIQIESQGIAEGLPFNFSAEARRVDNCSS